MVSKVNIVIIGASFAGLPIAHSLLKEVPNCRITLVNPSKTFYFTIAAPRILAKPKSFQEKQYLTPIEDGFKKYPKASFEFVQGTATAIDPAAKTVTIDNQTSISFDYLVIASGSTTPSTTGANGIPIPFKQSNQDNMQQLIERAQESIANATRIVIGGAGAIGVELAGEIAEAAKEAKRKTSITLVSATDRVLPTLKPAGSAAAEHLLAKLNVAVVKGHSVTSVSQAADSKLWTVSLDNGENLTADLYVPTTGVFPNNSFIPQAWLDKGGWLKVDNQLRVQGSDSGTSLPIFAAGDITTNSMRLSFKAAEQAAVVAANLKAEILGSGKQSYYNQGDSVMMVVPVGSRSGTGQLFGWTACGFLVKSLKAKDFLISKSRVAVMG